MQQDSIVSLRPLIASQRVLGSACADMQAAYGCVDWYLYQNAPPTAAESNQVLASSAVAAPCSSLIERAAAAAGAAVTPVARTVVSAEAGPSVKRSAA